MLNRLAARDRQVKFDPSLSKQCLFCDKEETRDHLFFVCSYSAYVWSDVMKKIGKEA